MRGTGKDEGDHSTVSDKALRRLRWRFFASLVLWGWLLGMMIGRFTAPGPVRVLELAEAPGALVLWLDRAAPVDVERFEGTYALRLAATGSAREGRLQLDGGVLVNWRLRPVDGGMVLGLVAVRPLDADWQARDEDGRWRLEVRLSSP